MRLDFRNNTILLAVVVELCIFALVGLVFLFQYNSAKDEFVSKTRAIAETIGDLSGSFFAEGAINPTSDEFYLFLDERLGRKKLFNTSCSNALNLHRKSIAYFKVEGILFSLKEEVK